MTESQHSNKSHLSDRHQQDELQAYQTGSLHETDPRSADINPKHTVSVCVNSSNLKVMFKTQAASVTHISIDTG